MASVTANSINNDGTFYLNNGGVAKYGNQIYIEGTNYILAQCYTGCGGTCNKPIRWKLDPVEIGELYGFTFAASRLLSNDMGSVFVYTGETDTYTFDYTNLAAGSLSGILLASTDFQFMIHLKLMPSLITFVKASFLLEKRSKASISTVEGTFATGLSGAAFGRMQQVDSTNYLLLTHNSLALLVDCGPMSLVQQLSTVETINGFCKISGPEMIFIGTTTTSSLTRVF